MFVQTNRTTPNPKSLKEHAEYQRLLRERANEIAVGLGMKPQ